MECAAKGSCGPCHGPATRRCGGCGALSYCSSSHQIAHWNVHKEQCGRLSRQMRLVDALFDFPFTFSAEVTYQVSSKQITRCSFLKSRGLHNIGIWTSECNCHQEAFFSDLSWNSHWHLPRALCPCTAPNNDPPEALHNWMEYYQWRCLPLSSPVALLMHWPLTIYYGIQLASGASLPRIPGDMRIHYLGPEKELYQLPIFLELCKLFPGVQLHIDLVGPAIPQSRDGEQLTFSHYPQCLDVDCTCKILDESETSDSSNCRLKIRLWRGLYHHRFKDLDSNPHYIIAANAGIAAYTCWMPTIELIRWLNVPAIFSDYCEEAAHLAACCISTITGCSLSLPQYPEMSTAEVNGLFCAHHPCKNKKRVRTTEKRHNYLLGAMNKPCKNFGACGQHGDHFTISKTACCMQEKGNSWELK